MDAVVVVVGRGLAGMVAAIELEERARLPMPGLSSTLGDGTGPRFS
ncbi:hypothetical protein [Mycobacterium sp. MAA66]